MGSQTKNSHSLQSDILKNKISKFLKTEKTGHLFDPVLGSFIIPGHLPDLRSNGQTDLSGSKYKCFDTP